MRDLLVALGHDRAHDRRPLARRRRRDADRLPVPGARASGSCWCPAAASGARSASCCAPSRCRGSELVLPLLASRPLLQRRRRASARLLGRLGLRAGAGPRGDAARLRVAGRRRRAPRVRPHAALGDRRRRPARRRAATGSTSPQRVPTLLVWGERDPIIPVEHGRARARADARAAGSSSFEGAGHFPHRDDPRALRRGCCAEFIATTEPADVQPGPCPRADARPRRLALGHR